MFVHSYIYHLLFYDYFRIIHLFKSYLAISQFCYIWILQINDSELVHISSHDYLWHIVKFCVECNDRIHFLIANIYFS